MPSPPAGGPLPAEAHGHHGSRLDRAGVTCTRSSEHLPSQSEPEEGPGWQASEREQAPAEGQAGRERRRLTWK